MTKQDEAKSFMSRHDWASAIPILLADISENPGDPWSAMYLGSCYYELRNHAEALEWFEQSAQLLPDDPLPMVLQADAWHGLGKVDQARELYRKALAMDPTSELAIKNWNRFVSLEGE